MTAATQGARASRALHPGFRSTVVLLCLAGLVLRPGVPALATEPAMADPLQVRDPAPGETRLPIKDDAIVRAVRETLAENPDKSVVATPTSGALRADQYATFERRMNDAVVPGCLRPDGLKFQPPTIGPVGLSGILALPFVALAKLRGKCR